MINNYLVSLISSKEILYSILISFICIIAVCYYLFGDYSSNLFSKLFLSIFLTLSFSFIILLLLYIPVFYLSKEINIKFLVISIIFFLFYYLNLIIKFTVGLKKALFKGKKRSSLEESLIIVKKDLFSRITTLLVFLSFLILAIVLVGNGRINYLMILLLLSGVVSSVSCIYIIPLFIKIFEKVIK